jgi:hypothetical protein
LIDLLDDHTAQPPGLILSQPDNRRRRQRTFGKEQLKTFFVSQGFRAEKSVLYITQEEEVHVCAADFCLISGGCVACLEPQVVEVGFIPAFVELLFSDSLIHLASRESMELAIFLRRFVSLLGD